MDKMTKAERIRVALWRAAGNNESLNVLVARFREQDRAGVRRSVELTERGSFWVLSEGEKCAAALVVPLYRGTCGPVERAARRCGLEWLRAVRSEFPDAVGLDLIPTLEGEEGVYLVSGPEEEIHGGIGAGACNPSG